MNTKRTAKVALATFGLSVMLPTAAFAATDTQGHWAGSVLAKWESQALISGYEDGTIRPDNEISRAEFVSLVNRVAGYQAAGSAVKFSDVKTGDWYAGQVAIAVNEGYIGGFEDNTFRPNDSVTRAQAAAIIARIKNLPSDAARVEQFADAAATPDWAKGVVGAVANAGYMIGDEANNFNAEKALTRAEAVAALDRVFEVKELAAQTLALSATEGVIAKGATKTITATSSVEGAVITAVSSDTDVATVTVKDGKVTIKGVEKGKATITVTAKADGYKIATATYTVDVTAAGGAGGGGGSIPDDHPSSSVVETATTTAANDNTVSTDKSITEDEAAEIKITKTVYNDTANQDAKITITSTGVDGTVQATSATLPKGTLVTIGKGNETITVTLESAIKRDTEVNTATTIKYGEIMDSISGADQDKVKDYLAELEIDSMDEDKVIITVTPNADNTSFDFNIPGMSEAAQWEVISKLQIGLAKK